MIVNINDTPYAVKQIEVKSPCSRGANTLYKVRFNNLKTDQKQDESYKGDDFLEDSDCQRREVQYSYFDGAGATGRTRPATMATGLVVQVPEYLGAGEAIKINTATNKFMSRA